MRPVTSFYTDKEAIRFIEKNKALIGVEVFVNEAKSKTDKIESLTYMREQTGNNIFIYAIACKLNSGPQMALYELVSINGSKFSSEIKL
jgi:hypothetical protein